MPKTKDAFALRGFDIEHFLQVKLAECSLAPTALKSLDADKDNFDDLQRARKSYARLDDAFKSFRKKIIRHIDRLLNYSMTFTKDIARLDDDQYYFSVVKPQSKRLADLSERYKTISQKLIEAEHKIKGIIYNIDQYQRGYYAKIFATRLRQARIALGLTQSELAEKLGVKRGTYNAYETARNEPNISILALVAREFNQPLNWFLGL